MNAVAEVSIDACVWWETRVGEVSKYSVPSLSDSVKLQNYEQSCNTCNKMKGQKYVIAHERHGSSLEFTPIKGIFFHATDSMQKYCVPRGVKEADAPGRISDRAYDDGDTVTMRCDGALQAVV